MQPRSYVGFFNRCANQSEHLMRKFIRAARIIRSIGVTYFTSPDQPPGKVPAARAARGDAVARLAALTGTWAARWRCLDFSRCVVGKGGHRDNYLLPWKPSEIAIDNGISRRIGGVLGIVFN